MIAIHKILVATDFSEHGAKAVRYGTELAYNFQAELHLLHVVQPTPAMYEEGFYFPSNTEEQIESAAIKQLDEVKIDRENVSVVRRVARGTPFLEIVRYAKENVVDLVIVGTHGRGAIAHMLLGSVADRVVRKAPCPVLVVRDEEHEFIMP